MTRKTIRLIVTMPDPGEWCELWEGGIRLLCPMLRMVSRDGVVGCSAGHCIPDAIHDPGVHRPQSCRDAEVEG